ncbi:phosphotransferase [Allopusillimonas ginsengisoli]|uniref:phosphotransferase n=1 Tax=Allopusillimonas ginsengisoli TaxID=453575 RepID=UPI00101F2D73|nr:phosphotransferase [Allopusillimonas ginsengisoli]TEA78819.1 aminoglycoside phosphotransferase [Allopusillimonas ginsengisoli]
MTDTMLSGIIEPLKTSPPDFSVGQAVALVQRHYGMQAQATQLTSERDQNFRMRTADGQLFVLKIANTAECHEVATFQTAALNHVAQVDPGLPVPRVIRTMDGQHNFLIPVGSQQAVVRMLSYLEGEPLYKAPKSRQQRFNIGQLSARLSLALRDFQHRAASHEILWDIENASHLRQLLVHIPDENNRALAERFLRRFDANVMPVLPLLRTQVVHNDLNPHNLLVDPENRDRVAGILDFGDMVRTALINDVAITASYLLSTEGNPLAPVVDMLQGYQSVSRLEWTEISLLVDLIATRYVMNVAITGWRAARYPENKAYILRNNEAAWAGLRCLDACSLSDLQHYLRTECYAVTTRSPQWEVKRP